MVQGKPTVSVLMPVWNQEELVLRALESIPKNVDEVIIVDDCSTDSTPDIIRRWAEDKPYVKILTNKKNRGVGYSINRCYDNATMDYTVILSSDDYFHPEMEEVINQIDGSDFVFFNLTYNISSRVRVPTEKNYKKWAGSCKLVRREFMQYTRARNKRVNEDLELYKLLLNIPHTTQFTGIFGKHYNTPRLGSLTDLKQKGKFGHNLVTVGDKHWERYNAEHGTDIR